MPKPPTFREVIDGRMVTIAVRRTGGSYWLEVNIYPGTGMTGEPQFELEYDGMFRDDLSGVARLAAREFPAEKAEA